MVDAMPVPQVHDWLVWVWRCWNRLAHDRPWLGGGMGPAVPGRIPYIAIRRWAKDHGIKPGSPDHLFLDTLVQELDEEYVGWQLSMLDTSGKGRL